MPSLEDLPIVAATLTLLALLLVRIFKKPAPQPSPPLPPVDVKPVEQKAEEKKAEAKAELVETKTSIVEQHRKAQDEDVREREELVPVILSDPEKLNEELKKTGKMIRESQHGRKA